MSKSQKVRDHLRSNVVGYVALFVSLTMTPALAAQIAPKNSVVSKSIKNGQVKSADVKNNGLTGADIKESTLKGLPIEGKLAASGAINAPANPVDWTKLKNVPDGFADGSDGPGELVANGGLQLTGAGLRVVSCPGGPSKLWHFGSSWSCVPDPSFVGHTNNSPTPSVAHADVVSLHYSSPTAITDLTGAHDGQIVTVMTTSNLVSIESDLANFRIAGDWTPNDWDTITLAYTSGIWNEVTRSSNE